MNENTEKNTTGEVYRMLELSEKNKPFNTIDNAVLILNNDPLFAGNIKDNLFRERIELDGNMPWSRSYVDVTDKDDIHIRHYIEKTYHYRNDKAVRDAMQIVATENEYHPVRNWLKSLEWDGTGEGADSDAGRPQNHAPGKFFRPGDGPFGGNELFLQPL